MDKPPGIAKPVLGIIGVALLIIPFFMWYMDTVCSPVTLEEGLRQLDRPCPYRQFNDCVVVSKREIFVGEDKVGTIALVPASLVNARPFYDNNLMIATLSLRNYQQISIGQILQITGTVAKTNERHYFRIGSLSQTGQLPMADSFRELVNWIEINIIRPKNANGDDIFVLFFNPASPLSPFNPRSVFKTPNYKGRY